MGKRRNTACDKEKYVDCSFDIGSVERLWSITKHDMTSSRRKITPQLLEALLFQRENERFWDEQLVSKAMNSVRSERVRTKFQAHEEPE